MAVVQTCSITRLSAPRLPLLHPLRVTHVGLAWDGPPLPLDSVTAAFRAVYLSPVGASALGWLGSESHLLRDELLFALQRKSLQVLALRVTARSHLRVESQGLKALVRGRRHTNGAIIRYEILMRQAPPASIGGAS